MNKVEPTEKQVKAISKIREGMSPTRAMKEAGYSDKTSQAPGRNLLSSAGAGILIEIFREDLLKEGITSKYLAKKTKEGLEANRVISAVNTDKQASGSTSDFIEVPDHQIRHKFMETASRWLGIDKPSGTQVAVGVNIPITIGEEVSDDQLIRRIVGIVEKIKSSEEAGNSSGSGGSGEAVVVEGHIEG